jgi:hypothetical protein
MAVYDILPDKDLKSADIRDTLNANGSSCTDEFISFFDSRAVINIWSFRKPYATDLDMFKLTDAQIKSSDVNCGLKPYQIAAYTNLTSKMDGDMNGWEYQRPTGGATSPYRLGDYVGYNPSAAPMIRGFYVPDEVPKSGTTTVSATAVIPTESGSPRTIVTIADIGSLSSFCPAVYLVNGDLSTMYESTTPISSGGFNVSIDISKMNTGTWTAYPFLKSGSTYFTIPNVMPKQMKITTSSFRVELKAFRADSGQTINWTLTIKNTSSAVTWGTNTWTLTAFSTNDMNGAISDISVNANGTTTVTGSITNVNDVLWNSPMLTLKMSLNAGNVKPSAPILQENDE